MTFRIRLLVVITIIAAILRFWGLGHNPPSLNWDEIAIGYNAYSVLQTGKDEYGNFLPSTFRSFEDYKSPIYVYLTVPAIAIFGKTEFAIRFTSALLGTLTIPLIYWLTSYLIRKDPHHHQSKNIGVIAAFLFATLPWHVHFSRVAFEANIALFFVSAATAFLFRWFDTRKVLHLLFATSCFALAIHSYANMRLFVPLLLLGLLLPQTKKIISNWKQLTMAFILGVFLISPLIIQLYQGVGFARYQATAIVNRSEIYHRTSKRFAQEIADGNTILAKVLYNPRIAILTAFHESYSSHFTYDFLFSPQPSARTAIPGVGLLYWWFFPLIFFGCLQLFIHQDLFRAGPLSWWLISAPIPAGLTWDTPNAIRAEVMLVPLTVISAIGLWGFLKHLQHLDIQHYKLSRPRFRFLAWLFPKLSFVVCVLTISFSVLRMTHNYHYHLPVEYAGTWLYGRQQMVSRILQLQPEFNEVRVSLSLDWSYLWFLWYGNIDPSAYLAAGGTKSGGFDFEGNTIQNIKFQNFNYTQESFGTSGILFVGTPGDFPPNFVPGEVIENTAGQKFIYLIRS